MALAGAFILCRGSMTMMKKLVAVAVAVAPLSAFAAVDAAVTDAITAAGTDAGTVAGAMIVVIAGLLAFAMIRRQVH